MKRITALIAASVLALFALTACGAGEPTATPLPQPTPTTPASAGNMTPGVAPVDSITINTLESNPVQIQAVIKGNLATPCVTIKDVTQTRDGNTITLTVNTLTKADEVCIDVIQPYEQTVTIDTAGLTAGTYTVVSGEASATFELNQR